MALKKIIRQKAEPTTPIVTTETLRGVIDREKLFTMIYSGVENETYFDILYKMGIRDFLISYHYISSRKSFDTAKYRNLGVKFFVDSGAYTFLTNSEEHDQDVEYWESYIKQYLNWARSNKDVIFAIANLDLESLMGFDRVLEWNKKYFEPFMIETGIPVCFIWHKDDGLDNWERYCQRYPYTGFSWVSDNVDSSDVTYGTKLFRIAEKYNTVCHGMGMTRTALLPKLPFYTVDSTTWLVGLQYGEINYWQGNKMSRLKKEKWKGEYLPKIVRDFGLDKNKLLNEETEELIKANVGAFIKAEEFVRFRLKSRMYWLRPDVTKNDANSESFSSLFPPSEWFDSEYDDWEAYATSLNISVVDKDIAISQVIMCTCFCNWESPDYEDYIEAKFDEEFINTVYDDMINQICTDLSEKVLQLRKFYTDVATGICTKLLYLGTNFDRITKEREQYIEEEIYEEEEVSQEEIHSKLQKLLPSGNEDPAPDITELDRELYKQEGIVVIRGEKGKFLKGQKKVLKPKQIYSEKYPKLACSSCYSAQTCPEYKDGYVCAFNKMFKRFDTRNMGDIIEAMQGMVGLNLERMQRVAIFEMLDGGLPNGTLTNMIDQNIRLLSNLKVMYQTDGEEVLRHTKTVKADGTVEESTSIKNPSSGGVLERLFSASVAKKETEESIPADFKEV